MRPQYKVASGGHPWSAPYRHAIAGNCLSGFAAGEFHGITADRSAARCCGELDQKQGKGVLWLIRMR